MLVENNFIGVVHDNASSLVGKNIGLQALLKQDGRIFFDLRDPCHGFNLALKNSLSFLPNEVNNFLVDIPSYFSSPQRRALLHQIH